MVVIGVGGRVGIEGGGGGGGQMPTTYMYPLPFNDDNNYSCLDNSKLPNVDEWLHGMVFPAFVTPCLSYFT